MDRSEIESIVFSCIEGLNHLREEGNKIEVSGEAPLYGNGGPLDSMALVTLVMDVEEGLASRGNPVSLSDAKAMSQKNSPYRSVKTLVDFVDGQLNEQAK